MTDVEVMRLCLRLARRGLTHTHPNPMVGAVVVRGGKIVAVGFHRQLGAPHAEIDALAQLGGRAPGATLYVNLEPCVHQGRTPPCVDALLQAGLQRVVVGMVDPNPRVRGRGIRKLRAHGLRVDVGVLRDDCARLNEAFVTAMKLGRPYVTLKAAMSLDGKMATRTGESKWITGPAARKEAHRLRAQHDAVLVGANTVLVDDPALTVRLVRGGNPIRVALDGRLRIPAAARIFDGRAPTWIATTVKASPAQQARYRAQFLHVPGRNGRLSIPALLKKLHAIGITSLLVEGGAETHAAFVESACVDRVVLFVAPLLIGGQTAPPVVGGQGTARLRDALRLNTLSVRCLGADWMFDARPASAI